MRHCPTLVRLGVGLLMAGLIGCNSGDNPPDRLHLEVVGEKYNWYIRYPGEDGLLHTPDDVVKTRHIHVPENTNLVLTISSKDLVYMFRLPDWDLKKMAIPEMTYTLSFNTGTPGTYLLKGDQMCGYAHDTLLGDFIVEEYATYKQWLATP